MLSCRNCKKNLIQYIACDMLRLIPHSLRSHQQFIPYSCTRADQQCLREDLVTDADKADLRVWLHCKHSCGVNKLIFSPDTDVYHIGLPLMQSFEEWHIIIQLSKHTHDKARYLDMNNLVTAMENDPDLSQIPPHLRPQVLQTIYVCTGCDYTSFFNGLGKVSFLTTFFQHATFIAGGSDPVGSLGSLNSEDTMAQYSFLRLVGCAYYKQHASAFRTQTPEALFHSFKGGCIHDQHNSWLASIRVETDSKTPP